MIVTRRDFMAGAGIAAVGARVPVGLAAESSMNDQSVLELRQYTLHKGQRDTLIKLFDEHFRDAQNAVGSRVLGTFRDLDDPDRLVWIRGFQDMATRQRALETFYGGPSWLPYKAAANATILDSDNVLLLRPASSGQGFQSSTAASGPGQVIGAWIYYLDGTDPEQFAGFYDRAVLSHLSEMGVSPIARLITHGGPNNFPRLPVREHDSVYIWFARWKSVKDEEDFSARWAALSGWRDGAPDAVLPGLMRKPERLRLAATARSELR